MKIDKLIIDGKINVISEQKMETPYTRDCESPLFRERYASLATISIAESTMTEVDVKNPTAMKYASQKLRNLLDALTSEAKIETATLIESISYAASVLDHNYKLVKKSALVSCSRRLIKREFFCVFFVFFCVN